MSDAQPWSHLDEQENQMFTRRLAIGRLTAVALAAGALVAAVAAPASADDSGYFPGSLPCKSGARYAAGWMNYGHWLFARDCKADGYGIEVDAWAVCNGRWYPLGYAWDQSSAGDGYWKSLAEIGPEGCAVELSIWETKNGAAFTNIGTLTRDYHT